MFSSGLPNTSIGVLTVDPASTSTVYAGTGMGVFKTTNAGGSWFASSSGLPGGESVWSLAIEPANLPLVVDIDIKPGSDPNSINCRHNGIIPVAILTTTTARGDQVDFDATTVDSSTLRFGPAAATRTHRRHHIRDVDGDGDSDMLLHFRQRSTGIQCRDVEACLSGETIDGLPIEACDGIRTVGNQRREHDDNYDDDHDDDDLSPYVHEHVEMVNSILGTGPYINRAMAVAESTMTAIMAREAAYAGIEVTWDMIMKSTLDLMPKRLDLEADFDGPPLPRPGEYQFT